MVTPSRYAAQLHALFISQAKGQARQVADIMSQHPGVIVCLNICIEEELAIGGEQHDGLLADYSPFAIAEFRDWLRHTGAYDADTGACKGQGAPVGLGAEHLSGGPGCLWCFNGSSRMLWH